MWYGVCVQLHVCDICLHMHVCHMCLCDICGVCMCVNTCVQCVFLVYVIFACVFDICIYVHVSGGMCMLYMFMYVVCVSGVMYVLCTCMNSMCLHMNVCMCIYVRGHSFLHVYVFM